MKTEILEHLIRSCVNEVLDQMAEAERPTRSEDEAEDPSANPQEPQPAQPQAAEPAPTEKPAEKPAEPSVEKPAEKPEPSTPPAQKALRGAVFINPRDKSKQVPLKFQARDDASLERFLHRTAAGVAGSGTKVSLSAMRMAKEAVKNPNTTIYFYLGKYDPESEEIFLMADKSLQVAKDASVQPAELTGTPVHAIAPSDYNPMTASPTDIMTRMDQRGHTPVRGSGIDEQTRSLIKKMVNEILDRR